MKVKKVMNNKNKLSITVKLLIIVLGLLFTTISVLTYFNEQNQKNKFMSYTDDKLRLTAYAANDYILQDYHDKVLDKDSINEEEYHNIMLKLSSFVNKIDLLYIYTFIKRDDKVLVTSTSVTKDDFDSDNYEVYFEEYEDVSKELVNSFENKEAFFEETRDSYGYIRTIFIPFENKYGEVYTVGVDIAMDKLESEIAESRQNIIMISLIIFVISAFLYFYFSKKVLGRITVIRDSLEEFFDYMNSKRDTLTKIELSGNDELNEMSNMINKNIELIGTNIKKDNNLINEISLISSHIKKGTFSKNIQKEANNPALNDMKNIFNDVLLDMQNVMLDILNVLKEFKKQNYNSKLKDYDLDGEVGKVVEQMNIFGKTISNNMLNTAYDSLNLEKDSKFTTDYMYELKKKFGEYLKTTNNVKKDVEHLHRYNSKSLSKIENILKENLFVEKLFLKIVEDFNSISNQVDKDVNIEILDKFDDLTHSFTILQKHFEDLDSLNDMSAKLFDSLTIELNEFEENILTGNNSIDQMQKVSKNLNALSVKMRAQIDNAEFNGKENIMMLMNHS